MREARLAKLQAAQLYLCTPEPLAPPGVAMVQLRRKGLEWTRGAGAAAPAARECAVATSATDRGASRAGQRQRPGRRRRLRAGRRAASRPGRPASGARPPDRRARGADRAVDARRGPAGGGRRRPRHRLLLRRARSGRRRPRPGRPGVGLGLLERAVALAPPFAPVARPWFVTGGVAPQTRSTTCSRPGPAGWSWSGPSPVRADPAAVSEELARRLREAAGSCAT